MEFLLDGPAKGTTKAFSERLWDSDCIKSALTVDSQGPRVHLDSSSGLHSPAGMF